MTNHFTAMGLPVHDDDSLREVLTRVLAQPLRAVELPDGESALSWRDLSGGGLDVLLDGSRLRCAVPQYLGDGRQSLRVTGVVDDPEGCPGCATVDVEVLAEDGEAAYPLTVAASEMVRRGGELADLAGEVVTGSVVLVAELVSSWPDEAAYHAAKRAESEGEPVLGARALVPIGQFGDGPPEPVVIVNGVVADARRRTSAEFGTTFWHVLLGTYGATYDLLVAADDLPTVERGQVLQAQAWVCGRVGEPS